MTFSLIKTPRLIIRQLRPDDSIGLLAYMSDPEVTAFLPEGPFSEAEAREFIEKNAGERAEAHAVILTAENRLIGHMVFHPWFAPLTYEIGWVFNRQYHGQGYATEAAFSLLEHGFEELKLHRVIATCQPENVASYRVMEKIGMRKEGLFRKCIFRGDGVWWDELFYAVLEDEWQLA
jgi:RimJ/RimL family protein N-acetyltransferase